MSEREDGGTLVRVLMATAGAVLGATTAIVGAGLPSMAAATTPAERIAATSVAGRTVAELAGRAAALPVARTAALYIALTTPVPTADKPTKPSVQPNPATPGTHIWVYDVNQCTAPNGTATSQALAAPIALAPLANMTGGGGTLREGLAAGTYTITLHCGSTLTATIHVNTTRRADTTPTGAAATGDGSAEDHLGIGDAAVGSAFLLGGLAFGTASYIRRRRAGARG